MCFEKRPADLAAAGPFGSQSGPNKKTRSAPEVRSVFSPIAALMPAIFV
jgi:hypothetical protein